jgi:hypothetical protein
MAIFGNAIDFACISISGRSGYEKLMNSCIDNLSVIPVTMNTHAGDRLYLKRAWHTPTG